MFDKKTSPSSLCTADHPRKKYRPNRKAGPKRRAPPPPQDEAVLPRAPALLLGGGGLPIPQTCQRINPRPPGGGVRKRHYDDPPGLNLMSRQGAFQQVTKSLEGGQKSGGFPRSDVQFTSRPRRSMNVDVLIFFRRASKKRQGGGRSGDSVEGGGEMKGQQIGNKKFWSAQQNHTDQI